MPPTLLIVVVFLFSSAMAHIPNRMAIQSSGSSCTDLHMEVLLASQCAPVIQPDDSTAQSMEEEENMAENRSSAQVRQPFIKYGIIMGGSAN